MSLHARKVSLGEAISDDRRRAVPAVASASVMDDDPAVAGLLVGLESVGRGAAVLDGDGKLIGTNERADALLGPLAVVHDGRLRGRTPVVTQRIDRLIARALTPGGTDAVVALGTSFEGTLVLRALSLAAGPCRFRRARVLLVPAQTKIDLPSTAVVREVFGLTATEAEVALALAGGATASAIARDRAVSPETVRSHLKTIYAKTGARRQAGLVASIMHLRDIAPG